MKVVFRVTGYLSTAVLVTLYSSSVHQTRGQVTTTEPDPAMCECECDYYDKLQKWQEKAEEEKIHNISTEEKLKEAKTELKDTQKKLSVNTTKLSSTTRKLVSADDKRTSAVSLGYLGAVFLGLVGASIIMCDLSTYVPRGRESS